MFMRKRASDACFGAFLFFVFIPIALAQTPKYTVTPIEPAAGSTVRVYANHINSRGFVAATSFPKGAPTQGFIWKNGKTTATVPTLGGSCSYGWGINDRGHVAGTACLAGDQVRHGVLWRNDHLIDLGSLGENSSARSVNCRDEVLGGYLRNDGSIRGFFWKGGQSADLGDLGGSQVFASELSDSGVVTGQSDISTNPDPVFGIPPFHGFSWKKGVLTDFGQVFGSDFGNGNGVDREGRIVGSADLAGDLGAHAFLWDRGSVRDLGAALVDPVSWGLEMNNVGEIVGSAGLLDSNPADGPPVNTMLCPCRAVLWQKGNVTYIDNIVDPQWNIQIPVSINDRGEIVALAMDNTTFWFGPVLLKPIRQASAASGISGNEAKPGALPATSGSMGPSRIHRHGNGEIQVEF